VREAAMAHAEKKKHKTEKENLEKRVM